MTSFQSYSERSKKNDALSFNSQQISINSHDENSCNVNNVYDSYCNTGNGVGIALGIGLAGNMSAYSVPHYSMVYGSRDFAPAAASTADLTTEQYTNVGDTYAYHSDFAVAGCDTGDSCDCVDDVVDGGEFGGRRTSFGTTKFLPQVPLKQSNTMLDGMYKSHAHAHQNQYHNHHRHHQYQGFGASLPTPPAAPKKNRALPQPAIGHSFSSNNNGSSIGGVSTGATVCVAAAPNTKCLSMPPSRALPQPQTQPRTPYKHELTAFAMKRDILPDSGPLVNTASKDAPAECNTHDNATIGDYAAMSLYSSTSYSDAIAMQGTGVQLSNAGDYNCVYSDNVSFYSDPTMTATQLQLQNSSITMETTTAAAVVPGVGLSTDASRNYRMPSFGYDDVGVATPKKQDYEPLTNDYFFDNGPMSSNRDQYATTEIMPSYKTSIDSLRSTPSTMPIRKLPKLLPTPQTAIKSKSNNGSMSNYVIRPSLNSKNHSSTKVRSSSSNISSTHNLAKLSHSILLATPLSTAPTSSGYVATTLEATAINTLNYSMTGTYFSELLDATTATATATSPTSLSLSKPLFLNDHPNLDFAVSSVSTPNATTVDVSSKDNASNNNNTIGPYMGDAIRKVELPTSSLNTPVLTTSTSSVSITPTKCEFDYSEYLKSYTLPPFSDYISNMRTNGFDITSVSSQPLTTSTSPSQYELSTYVVTCLAETSTSYQPLAAKTLSPTSRTVGAEKEPHYDDNSFSIALAGTASSLSLSSPTTALKNGALCTITSSTAIDEPSFLKTGPDPLNSFSNFSHSLDKIVTTDAKESTADLHTSTTNTLSYNVSLFTTTVSSSALPSPTFIGTPATATSTLTGTGESSYDEYMKQFNLDAYTTSPVVFNVTTTTSAEATPATLDNYAQYTSDYSSTNYSTTFSFLTDFHLDDSCALLPPKTTEATTATSAAIDDSKSETSNSSIDIAVCMSAFNADYKSSYTEALATSTTAEEVASSVVAFDDSFYDSYKVDLSALTAFTPSTDKATPTTCEQQQSVLTYSYLNALPTAAVQSHHDDAIAVSKAETTVKETAQTFSKTTSNDLTIDCSNQYTSTYHELEFSESTPKLASTSAQNTAAATTASQKTMNATAAKASSIIGGFSKGIKGGLDGVLSGASVTHDTTEQQKQPKKGFGYGLASKLVPNVGGFLYGAAAMKPQQTATSANSTDNANTQPQQHKYANNEPSTTIDERCQWTESSPQSNAMLTTDQSHADVYDTKNSTYYDNNSMQTVVTSSVYDDQDYNELQLQQQDEASPQHSNVAKIVDYSTDYKYGYDEYGYSESDYIATGDITEYVKNDGSRYYTQIENSSTLKTAEAPPIQPAATSTSAKTTTLKTSTSASITTATASNKNSFSLFSLANTSIAEEQIQQPQTKPPPSSGRSGGGLFGSFLGKAAAAVQSATQAVNQGASIASAVVQKVPTADATVGATSTNEEVYGDSSVAYMSHGDDYENCNVIVTATAATTSTTETTTPAHINKRNNNCSRDYYGEGSQETMMSADGPTVPPAASTGKKLPIINGKFCYPVQKQPTEVFDNVNDEDDLDFIENDENVGKNGFGYRRDSEQDDCYGEQQTTPLPRGSSQELAPVARNCYYKQTSSDYDYREDYFNEEDEFKYLEKEQNDEMALHSYEYHSYPENLPNQLDHIEESRDDYSDDNYPSVDSGNYQEDSSSGSGGGVVVGGGGGGMNISHAHKTMQELGVIASESTPMTTATPVGVVHQQIKKQDSIILVGDEDELGMGVFTNGKSNTTAPNSSRKSSGSLEDEQLTELPQIKQDSRKMLMRGETEEVVAGHMHKIKRQSEVSAKQRWHWAYNKIIMQLNLHMFPVEPLRGAIWRHLILTSEQFLIYYELECPHFLLGMQRSKYVCIHKSFRVSFPPP